MLSKEAANDTSTTLQSNRVKYFEAEFTKPEAPNLALTANYTTTGGSAVVAHGQVDVPTVFMSVLGFNKITVAGSPNGARNDCALRLRSTILSPLQTCNNINAAGITLYTIQVNTDGDPTATLLQNCACDSTKFWMLTSASGINTVFNQIGTNLTQLRVEKQ